MIELANNLADRAALSQQCFRGLLDGFSFPGRIQSVTAAPGAELGAVGLPPAMAAIALTLVDPMVEIWLDPLYEAARPWLTQYCGGREAGRDAAEIAFVKSVEPLPGFRIGDAERPELGATVVAEVTGLGRGETLILSGPGIDGFGHVQIDGLPHDFAAQWTANTEAFPCGIDLVLCSGSHFVVLARTTRLARG